VNIRAITTPSMKRVKYSTGRGGLRLNRAGRVFGIGSGTFGSIAKRPCLPKSYVAGLLSEVLRPNIHQKKHRENMPLRISIRETAIMNHSIPFR
jgi:hypothetical protein